MEKECNDSNETQALLDFVSSSVGLSVEKDSSSWETDVEDTPGLRQKILQLIL